MPSRTVRFYSRPLGAEDPESMKGPKMVKLSHWALVVGDPPELLLEVVAVQGLTLWTPLNKLQTAIKGQGLEKKLSFFKPFDPSHFTNMGNEEIIEIASFIVTNNPIYNIFFRNCQHFVLDLSVAIIARGWSNIFMPKLLSAPVTMARQGVIDGEEYSRLVDMLVEMRFLPSNPALDEVQQVIKKIESGAEMGGFCGEMYLPELTAECIPE